MKPINLKIKGLNSFIETQEINFEKLTNKGLFGIFGPTGSGKSTILDGITLALYGEISRKSTNYINTNCETLHVSYEFQISENNIRRYRVDREFKRDTKTGNVRAKSAKIIDITNDEVLEDKPKLVTEKCIEIIGLKLEDFTRTVVLPQGKFSEFLKLEGRERRDMLERLFNLQKYGDELSDRLSIKIKEEYHKANVLDGELRVYEDVSDEILEEKNKLLNEVKLQIEKCYIELEEAEKAYTEGKEVWNLQNELKELENRFNVVYEQESEIKGKQNKINLGESSLKVLPYLNSYEETLRQIKIVSDNLNNIKEKSEVIKIEKSNIETKLLEVKNKKDIELPKLKIKEQQLLDAIEEKKLLINLINEKKILENSTQEIQANIKDIDAKLEIIETNISKLNQGLSLRENKVESLTVLEEFKNKVNDGFILLNTYENIKTQKLKLLKDSEIVKSSNEALAIKFEVLAKELNEKDFTLKETENSLKNITENCPGDQKTLISFNEKLNYFKDKWNKDIEYTNSINASKNVLESAEKELNLKEKEKKSLEEEIISLKNHIKKIETENLAHTLRESLIDGEECPVCGSVEHYKLNVDLISLMHGSNLEELSLKLTTKENKLNMLNTEIIIYQSKISTEENNIKQNQQNLKNLGDDYKDIVVEELQKQFNDLYNNINKYNQEKIILEKLVRTLSEEKNNLLLDYNKIKNTLDHNNEQLIKFKLELSTKNDEISKIDTNLKLLKEELDVEDFVKTRNEINQKEEVKVSLEKEIKQYREKLKAILQNKESLLIANTNLKVQLEKKLTTLFEKSNSIEEKKNNLQNKVGNEENLDALKNKVNNAIINIEKEYELAELNKLKIEKLFNEYNDKIISMQGNLISLKERSEKDHDALNYAIEEEGFNNVNEVRKNYITKIELENLKKEIETYKNTITQLMGALTSVKSKLNNRNLSLEKWTEIQQLKIAKTNLLNNLKEASISYETDMKSLVVRLTNKKALLVQKKSLDYKLGLLSDLEKLFKGKKFVEFVAANQLKYVSMEASKKLKEITGGNYGLEVDENGKFLIRDYKNGGSKRDSSTLSGGEVFIASLALALALSSQIQLKGAAPLELFFLDEGFGSLDDNLLDVVMDSLEKIHNDKLSIGIISHVELIKNRIPIKLIVTPAEAGLGGSKVKIEKS